MNNTASEKRAEILSDIEAKMVIEHFRAKVRRILDVSLPNKQQHHSAVDLLLLAEKEANDKIYHLSQANQRVSSRELGSEYEETQETNPPEAD